MSADGDARRHCEDGKQHRVLKGTPQRTPRGHEPPEQETAGDRQQRHQVRAGEDGHARGGTRPERTEAAIGGNQHQRQRPPRRRREIAHRSHRDLEEHRRARRDEHGGNRPGERTVHATAKEIRRQHEHAAEEGHDPEHAVGSEQPLEDRHDEREPGRIGGRDCRPIDGRPIAERRNDVERDLRRQLTKERRLLTQLADAPEMSLADIAVRVRGADDKCALGQTDQHHPHDGERSNDARGLRDRGQPAQTSRDDSTQPLVLCPQCLTSPPGRRQQPCGDGAEEHQRDRIPSPPGRYANTGDVENTPAGPHDRRSPRARRDRQR